MALFNDGTMSGTEDLRAQESSILELAATEGVDLTAKLALAQEEIGIAIGGLLAQRQTGPGLAHVVATTALRRWHTLRTLTLVFRDAFGSQFNERYSRKQEHYERLSREAAADFYRAGIGIAARPIPKARQPEARLVPIGGAAGTYSAQVRWLGVTGEAGSLSNAVILSALSGERPAVKAIEPPDEISGWDVYLGLDDGEATKQNESPIAPGEEWILPETGLIAGQRAGDGQIPDYFIRVSGILQRG